MGKTKGRLMAKPTPPEFRTLGSLPPGTCVLELGNKKRTRQKREPLYRTWYESIGVEYWCTDINGEDGAICWDIRLPPPEELVKLSPFDVITNFGFTEHVQTDEGQEACWNNIHSLLKVNGQLSCALPQPGFWKKHGAPSGFPGIYYPFPSFFEEISKLNEYTIEDLWIDNKRHLVCVRMFKLKDNRFIMPTKGMFRNQ